MMDNHAMQTKKHAGLWRRFFPLWIFLIALLARLIPVMLTRNLGIGLDDMFQYDMLARSLVSGNGYRWYTEPDLQRFTPYVQFDLTGYDPRGMLTSHRAPLYPGFLALIYLVAGIGFQRFFATRLIQTILGASLAPLTFHLANMILPGKEKIAQVSGWIMALYPMLVMFPLGLVTENLFFPLLLLGVITLMKGVEKGKNQWFLYSGIIFGLSALTRSVILLAILVTAAWLFWFAKKKVGTVIFLLAMLVTIAPWVIRNSLLYGKWTGIETSLGYNLYVSYHPQSEGTFQAGISFDLLTILDDGVRDEAGMQAFKQFIKDDPLRVPYLALRRLGFFFGLERRALTYFYSNNIFGYIPTPLLILIAGIFLLPFMFVSTLAALGMALPWDKSIGLIGLFMLAYLIPHIVIISEERFHLAIVPFMALFAARGVFGLKELKAISSDPKTRWKLMITILILVLLFVNWGVEIGSDWKNLVTLFGPNGNRAYFNY
jgi:hypothetical protein